MALTKEDVEQVARLSALSLTEEEIEEHRVQLSSLIGYFEKLLPLDVEGVSPTDHASAGAAPLREDRIRESLPPEEALANAPAREGTSFLVPRIIE